MPLYPLKFHPRLVVKMWGGRKLQTVLGKALPPDKPVGESWELYDFPPGVVEGSSDWVSSVIADGPYAGRTLHWAMQEFGRDLLGSAKPAGVHGQFPLLIKFLDAREDLSVQVHPDEQYAREHPEAHLKTEAWYVIQHDRDARLFKGLRPGATRDQFGAAIERGQVEQHLQSIDARIGDCHYLPSGTVHALGGGILVAEVQTPSDTTFRVYDFNRVDPSTGKHRKLHVREAMQCIKFEQREEPPPAGPAGVLVRSPFFQMRRIWLRAGAIEQMAGERPIVLIMLEGNAGIRAGREPDVVQISRGQTVLLPASLKNITIDAEAESQMLEVSIP
jgi:mannose-6-phosphate isomerase